MSENSSRQLPVEILGEIFGQIVGCIELRAHPLDRIHRDSHNPWNLALVCKNWRDAAFLTPFIWCHIALDVVSDTSCKYNAFILALKLCLGRSCTYPLDIALTDTYGEEEELAPLEYDSIPIFLKLLMEHAQRWRKVDITFTLSAFLSNCPVQYTRLCHLHINSEFWYLKDDSLVLFKDAPLLSAVTLDGFPHCRQHISSVGIPWSQITYLNIYLCIGQLADLVDVLDCTPNLVYLQYKEQSNRDGEEWESILELPQLQQLVWESGDGTGTDSDSGSMPPDGPATFAFFEMLIAPRLSVLQVEGTCRYEEMEAIRGCLERSRCPITSLHFSSPRVFNSLLRLTPYVRTLVCTHTEEDGDEDDDFGDGSFELAHLEKIVCEAAYGPLADSARRFFERFTAPKLSVLAIIGKDPGVEVESISNFLRRSKCSIKTLCVTVPSLSLLRDLTLDVETFWLPLESAEDLMHLLTELTLEGSPTSWLFPKLKKFVLDSTIPCGPEVDALIRMLDSRLREPPNSLAQLGYNKIRELRLRSSVWSLMMFWIQWKLKEYNVVTYDGDLRLEELMG